jgi:uncharacterized repeat protein (TIGR01451 family)
LPKAKISAASTRLRLAAVTCSLACVGATGSALAAGVPAGTVIENTATVTYELAGATVSVESNPSSITVAERIDVVVTRQSPQVAVQPGEENRAILFRVTNTGNGSEAFALALDSNIPGADFNPVPAATSIYFDTDDSGDLSPGDVAYQDGVNEPVLPADGNVAVLLVNDIPSDGPVNGDIGIAEITASATTGTGVPGQSFPGQGDGNTDAVLGVSGGSAAEIGEYVITGVQISVVKEQLVSDPFGGSEPVPGATITYTVTVEVTSAGTATNALFSDPVPEFTTYSAETIELNGGPLTDAADGDAGELDTSGVPTVVIRLGDLTQADGPQVLQFRVTID